MKMIKETIWETVCVSCASSNYALQNSILEKISQRDSVCYPVSNFVRTFMWRPIADNVQNTRNSLKSYCEETIK